MKTEKEMRLAEGILATANIRAQKIVLPRFEAVLKESEADRSNRDEWKAIAESFAMVTAEFVNDWVKGDFKLEKLAACDAEAFRTPLEAFTKLKASAESANRPSSGTAADGNA